MKQYVLSIMVMVLFCGVRAQSSWWDYFSDWKQLKSGAASTYSSFQDAATNPTGVAVGSLIGLPLLSAQKIYNKYLESREATDAKASDSGIGKSERKDMPMQNTGTERWNQQTNVSSQNVASNYGAGKKSKSKVGLKKEEDLDPKATHELVDAQAVVDIFRELNTFESTPQAREIKRIQDLVSKSKLKLENEHFDSTIDLMDFVSKLKGARDTYNRLSRENSFVSKYYGHLLDSIHDLLSKGESEQRAVRDVREYWADYVKKSLGYDHLTDSRRSAEFLSFLGKIREVESKIEGLLLLGKIKDEHLRNVVKKLLLKETEPIREHVTWLFNKKDRKKEFDDISYE